MTFTGVSVADGAASKASASPAASKPSYSQQQQRSFAPAAAAPAAAPAVAGPFCTSCGSRNGAEARFCGGCGKATGASASSSAVASSAPAPAPAASYTSAPASGNFQPNRAIQRPGVVSVGTSSTKCGQCAQTVYDAEKVSRCDDTEPRAVCASSCSRVLALIITLVFAAGCVFDFAAVCVCARVQVVGGGRVFHSQCFRCTGCKSGLNSTNINDKDGKIYCNSSVATYTNARDVVESRADRRSWSALTSASSDGFFSLLSCLCACFFVSDRFSFLNSVAMARISAPRASDSRAARPRRLDPPSNSKHTPCALSTLFLSLTPVFLSLSSTPLFSFLSCTTSMWHFSVT